MQGNKKILEKIKSKYGKEYVGVRDAETIEQAVKVLCTWATTGEKTAIQGIKQYGKYAPNLLKAYLPLVYEEQKDLIKELQYKGKTAQQIEILKELETNGRGFRTFGYTKTQKGIDFLNKSRTKAIFHDAIGGSAEYNRMFDIVKAGDTLYIYSLETDLNNQEQLAKLLKFARDNGITVKGVEDAWLNSTTPDGISMISGILLFSKLNTGVEANRQAEKLAYTSGVKKGNRLKAGADMNRAVELWTQGELTATAICEQCNVSRSGLWKRLKALGLK